MKNKFSNFKNTKNSIIIIINHKFNLKKENDCKNIFTHSICSFFAKIFVYLFFTLIWNFCFLFFFLYIYKTEIYFERGKNNNIFFYLKISILIDPDSHIMVDKSHTRFSLHSKIAFATHGLSLSLSSIPSSSFSSYNIHIYLWICAHITYRFFRC